MPAKSKREASIPNPALADLDPLIGQWDTTGTHPRFPETTFHGRASFEWQEGGAFLLMRTEMDEPGIPAGLAIFGSDDILGELYMLYFDERRVSRKYDVSLHDNILKWWREAPDFSQRFTLTIVGGGQAMIGKGELSRDGATWEKDLELTYLRAG